MFRCFSNFKYATKALSSSWRNYHQRIRNNPKWLPHTFIIPLAVLSSVVVYEYYQSNGSKVYMEGNESEKLYRQEEISKHKTKANRVWVTYGDGVYDITGTLF